MAREDAATRCACEAMAILDDRGMTGNVSPESYQWWQQHLDVDRRRLEHEANEAARRFLRHEALAKLTQAEREALGIKGCGDVS